MNKLVLIIILTLPLLVCNTQAKKNSIIEIKDLGFMEGKWKAAAGDSTFISIREYNSHLKVDYC